MSKIQVKVLSFLVVFFVASLVLFFLIHAQIAAAILTLVLSSMPLFCAIVGLFGEVNIKE